MSELRCNCPDHEQLLTLYAGSYRLYCEKAQELAVRYSEGVWYDSRLKPATPVNVGLK